MNLTEEQIQKRNAKFVKEMLETNGWQVIEQSLLEVSKNLVTELMASNDPEMDRSLKADIRAIDKFLDKIKFYASIDTNK